MDASDFIALRKGRTFGSEKQTPVGVVVAFGAGIVAYVFIYANLFLSAAPKAFGL